MHKKMWKVVCPIEKKDGSGTYWARLGNAHGNKDESINVYLDTLPLNGKIQLREWTEEELRERDQRRSTYGGSSGGGGNRAALAPQPAGAPQSLPF